MSNRYAIKRTADDMNAIYRVENDGALTYIATRITGHDALSFVSAQSPHAELVSV